MIVNLAAYQFTLVEHPEALAANVRCWAEAGDLRGTVLVAGEGINLFLAGSSAAIDTFLGHLRADPRFADIGAKLSHSQAQPFARLKVKVKPEIISFRRDGASPLAGRARALAPVDLARWIAQGHDDTGRRLVLLDTRNREEVAHGTFSGALALPIDNFTELPEALAPHRETLAAATVVSFCTGGIRCEKAALHMRELGMANVYQLDGGILGYLEHTDGTHWQGDCFVFDERGAIDKRLLPSPPLPGEERAGGRGAPGEDASSERALFNTPASTRPSPQSSPQGERRSRCLRASAFIDAQSNNAITQTSAPKEAVTPSPLRRPKGVPLRVDEDRGEGRLAGKFAGGALRRRDASLWPPRGVSPSPCPLPKGRGNYGVFVMLRRGDYGAFWR